MQKFDINAEEQEHHQPETRIVLPPHVGEGFIQRVTSSGGMQIFMNHYRLHQPAHMTTAPLSHGCGFGFCLSGEITALPAGFTEAFNVRTAQSGFFHFAPGKMEETVGIRPVTRISIMFAPERLAAIAEKYPTRPMALLKQYPCRVADTLTPNMRSALLQMLNCPFEGAARDFFLEGTAMELLAYKLDQLGQERHSSSIRPHLTAREIDCAHFVAEYLTRDLGNTPDMSTLARKAGTNRSKLFLVFRHVFGQTPFEYLHQQRLETARTLLSEGGMNVTQAACAVGYSSLSHFSKAFKRHFGWLPGKVVK